MLVGGRRVNDGHILATHCLKSEYMFIDKIDIQKPNKGVPHLFRLHSDIFIYHCIVILCYIYFISIINSSFCIYLFI